MAICAYGLGAIAATQARSRHGHSDSVLGIFSIIDAHGDAVPLPLLADAAGYARKSRSERLHSSSWHTCGADCSHGGNPRSTYRIVFQLRPRLHAIRIDRRRATA